MASKLDKKWTYIYIIPIEKYVCRQAELVSMANAINPSRSEDILSRRMLILFSKSCLDVLDKKLKVLGCAFDKQYKLLKGVLDSDRKKLSKVPNYKVASDEELINLMVSKCVKLMIFDNF